MKKDLNPITALCLLGAFLFALVGHAVGDISDWTLVFLVVVIILLIEVL